MRMDVEQRSRRRRKGRMELPRQSPRVGQPAKAEMASEWDWVCLDRYLTLGTEVGAYRVGLGEAEFDGMESSVRCVRTDAARVVERVIALQEGGHCVCGGAGIQALALVTAQGDDAGRAAACAGVPRVCRTAADLFLFADRVTTLRGWGRGLRRAVGNWYRTRFADDLAYQVVKCPRKEGWSHRDLLRLAHPTPATREQAAVFRWILGGPESLGCRTVVREMPQGAMEECGEGVLEDGLRPARRFRAVTYPGVGELPRLLRGVEEAKRVSTCAEVVRLIAEHDLPREGVPASWLGELPVWEALLQRMPLGATIRDLGALSAVGLVTEGSEAAWWVETRLRDPMALRASGLHPMAFLLARRAYETGHAGKEGGRWKPVPGLVAALDDAFYAAFRNVVPVGRPALLALDLSVSTGVTFVPGTSVTVREAIAAMALVAASTETSWVIAGLTNVAAACGTRPAVGLPGLTLLDIAPGLRLEEAVSRLAEFPVGDPDCAGPMEWARRHRLPFESFVVYTDGEVWAHETGPSEALKRYRDEIGIHARSVVVGMAGAGFELADPTDPGMLDVVGFDASTPGVIAEFLRGSPKRE